MRHEFTCNQCQREIVHEDSFTTGYALDKDNSKICYDCCAWNDNETMIKEGHSKHLPLYLGKQPVPEDGSYRWKISNWPGTLAFYAYCSRNGRHNMAGTRTDVWFHGPDGFVWHGWQVGDSSIVHCKRTKESF